MLSSYQCEYYFILLAITECLCSAYYIFLMKRILLVLTSFLPQIIFNQGRPIELESVSPLRLIKSVMGAGVECQEGGG